MLDDLDLATSLARDAAVVILNERATARNAPKQKADDSPVTAADLAADAVIRAGLARARPDDLVVTEESYSGDRMPAGGRAWIVDPIDGTSDFVAGTADYVVQIALVEDGAATVGVILQPETGIIWRGVAREGARRCERLNGDHVTPLALRADDALPARPRFCISVSHPSAVVDFVTGELGADVLGIGSVGLKIGAIVDGRADAYVTGSRRIKVWDTAAPAAVFASVGGVLTNLSAKPLRYDGAVLHDDGVAALSLAARPLWPRIDEAVRRFRASAPAR